MTVRFTVLVILYNNKWPPMFKNKPKINYKNVLVKHKVCDA